MHSRSVSHKYKPKKRRNRQQCPSSQFSTISFLTGERSVERPKLLLKSLRSRKARDLSLDAQSGCNIIKTCIRPQLSVIERRRKPKRKALSRQISDRLSEMQTELARKKNLLEFNKQEISIRNKQIKSLRAKCHNALTHSHFEKIKFVNKTQHTSKLYIYPIILQAQKLYEKSYAFRELAMKDAHIERENEDSLFKNRLQMNHFNSLLKLTNTISGERLKGLYTAFHSKDSPYEHMKTLPMMLQRAKQDLTFSEQDMARKVLTLSVLVWSNICKISKMQDWSEFRRESLSKINAIKQLTREKIHILSSKISVAEKDKSRAQEYVTMLSKKFQELSAIYANQKKRLQKIYSNKHWLVEEERACKNCGKEYIESSNNAFACCIHSSIWSGLMYWCCGKTQQEAPGCFHTFHESYENQELMLWSVSHSVCSSCKQQGHSHSSCPKDPNVKNSPNPSEELGRLLDLKDYKKKQVILFDLARDNDNHWTDINFLKEDSVS